ncbi:DUF2147 domain-containing protein [Roseovarius sp. SYSU LYC5161]|uniref:DUF2147 domain-containing protein n=1 Tax=Roseovarius halophilus (ex Wu et al. 2025) TaxID=3376060 RepID=UPI0028721383|nr:DUF2147 domain-containing protein [Roseovarius sp.]
MRRMASAAAVLVLGAGMAAADPAEGLWKTEPGESGGYLHVALYSCGSSICGVIKQAFDGAGDLSDGYDHLGKRMIWDMTPIGGGVYESGRIWAPDRDKTYKSNMTLDGNRLEVEGCVLVICRAQTWTRVR